MSLAKCKNYELCNDLCKYLNDNLKDQQIKIDIKTEERGSFAQAKLIIYSNNQEYIIVPYSNDKQDWFTASTDIPNTNIAEDAKTFIVNAKTLDDFQNQILKFINIGIINIKQNKQEPHKQEPQNNFFTKSWKERNFLEKIFFVILNIPVLGIWALSTGCSCNNKKSIITKETVNDANKVVPFTNN